MAQRRVAEHNGLPFDGRGHVKPLPDPGADLLVLVMERLFRVNTRMDQHQGLPSHVDLDETWKVVDIVNEPLAKFLFPALKILIASARFL